MKAKLAICASGDGTNFEAIVQSARAGELQAEIVGLIVNRAAAGAVARATRLGVPVRVLSSKEFASRQAWDEAMVSQLKSWGADWIALAGYLALIGPQVLAVYPKRIVNTHPALLPKYGGEGMYGLKVHEAVIAAGEKVTGVTVHLIDEVYDRGLILKQAEMLIKPEDTAATLSERLKALENQIYPKILNDLLTGRLATG